MIFSVISVIQCYLALLSLLFSVAYSRLVPLSCRALVHINIMTLLVPMFNFTLCILVALVATTTPETLSKSQLLVGIKAEESLSTNEHQSETKAEESLSREHQSQSTDEHRSQTKEDQSEAQRVQDG